ncbi:MAG: hypothetical protein H7175_14840 [Burkholderiales bacterium]|nr:hypothetical protein [Anaerolineae bacterium]
MSRIVTYLGIGVFTLVGGVGFGQLLAQDDISAAQALVAQNVTIGTQTDAFGQEALVATGRLLNQSDRAYSNVNLFAAVINGTGEAVGEGYGYPVNACGEGLLADFTLQPGATQPFSVALELYESDETAAEVLIVPEAEASDSQTSSLPLVIDGISPVTGDEVVSVEWVDGQRLLYGVGCWRDPFNQQRWLEYDTVTGVQGETTHPHAGDVTDALRATLNLTDPIMFGRSFLQFAPGQRRLFYQTDLNSPMTAEPDGSFLRVLYTDLYNRSLQGVNWLRDGAFLAYYHGGFGDDVLYFTATVDGQNLSNAPLETIPSLIVPGASPDGSEVIIAAGIDGVLGYYRKYTNFDTINLLFEAEPPGNNWPAPLYQLEADAKYVYIARSNDGEAILQCYDMESGEMNFLTRLPLSLSSEERGWMWFSPDYSKIALAANGVNGGLWIIDLTAYAPCGAS